jgi:hypothetical protein
MCVLVRGVIVRVAKGRSDRGLVRPRSLCRYLPFLPAPRLVLLRSAGRLRGVRDELAHDL